MKWSKNDQPLDMNYDKFNGGTASDDCLVIKSPSDDDKGKYSCTVTNDVGSVTKDIVLGKFPFVLILVLLYDRIEKLTPTGFPKIF